MKLKKAVAAVTAAMLTMSAVNLSGIAAEEALPSDYYAEQSFTVAHPVGGVLNPVATAVSEEEAELISQTAAINREVVLNSMPRRVSARNRSSVNHSSSYFYDNIKSTESKQIYEDVVNSLSALLTSSADIIPDEDGSYFADEIDCGSGISTEEAREIINAVYYSNPQLFFFRGGYSYSYSPNAPGIVLSIFPSVVSDFANGAKRMEYQSKIQSVTNEWMPQISALKTNVEKEMKVAKLLCDYIDYDYNDLNNQNGLSDNGQTLAGALAERKCVCNGYAMAMAYFCNAFGMDSFLVVGQGHAWNAIDTDGTGTYTEVDVTWMDGDSDEDEDGDGNYENLNYVDVYWFNKSNASFKANDEGGSHNYDINTHSGIMALPATYDFIQMCGSHADKDLSDTIGTTAVPCAGSYYYIAACPICYWSKGTYSLSAAKSHDFKNGELTSNAEGHGHMCAYGCGTVSELEEHTSDAYVTTDAENHWKECTVCEYKIDIGKHTYGENGVCTVCGKEKPVCDHKYDAGTVTKEATCTEKGEKTFICTLCKEIKTEEIDMIDHTEEVLAAKEATCTETGLTEGKKCSVCGKVTVEQEVIPLKAHTPVVSGRVEPTCTKEGMTSGTKCSVCGTILEAAEIIPALDHDWEEIAAVPATCTKEGTTAGKKCKREGCGVTEGCEVIEKLPHTEVIDAAVAATCTKTGLTEGKHCSVCETVITKQTVIAALGHDWVTDAAVAATCTEPGLTEGRHCSRCDEKTEQQVIDKKGHNFVDGVCTACGEMADAECEHIGGELKMDENEHYKICTKCSARIEAEAHRYGEFETTREASCTAAGSRTHSCTTCGFVQTEEIPALGHSFADGKCTVCGADDPDYAAPTPEEPEKPVDNNNNNSASTVINYPTVIPFGYEVKTSEQIVNEVSSIAEGGTTEIKLSGNTTLDRDVLESVAGKDVTVTVRIPGGSYWTINGKDVEKTKKVNLGVRMNRKVISEDRISELSGGKKTVQFSLKHNGEFGFTGILNVPVNKIYNGKYANLYYDNKDSFEFMGSSLISNGIASFAFTHASDYVIVIDDNAYGEDVSSAAGVYSEAASADGVYVAVIFAAVFTGTAAVIKKRKVQ